MKRILLSLCCILTLFTMDGQPLYSKGYGNVQNPPIIFIHGGPGGNATLFEATTAQKLADNGFYVIVYDRRGEGRSIDTNATFTYQEAIADLRTIYLDYKIEKASLIGHSFGGLVATFFSKKYPEKVNTLILAGALFAQQETYDHILATVKKNYEGQSDSIMLAKVCETEKLNRNSAAYRKECFELASQNNFFKMPKPTPEAEKLRHEYETSEFYRSNIRNIQAPIRFYRNEAQNNIDTKSLLRKLEKKGVKLFAIYGGQDGIFSASQLNALRNIVKKENFKVIDNCSHYLFVDQQKSFIESIVKRLK